MAKPTKSQKPKVIERIYERLLDPTTGHLTRTVVTNQDVADAIRWCNLNHGSTLSDMNPANFMKDIVRGRGASSMWPERLKLARVSGRQITGDGNVFEFVDYLPGQVEPFPIRFGYHAGVVRHKVQSLSMSTASKALGRDDETYLIQVAVKLSIVETHFALHSKVDVTELSHLQIGIKLRLTEVDSMFLAHYRRPDGKTDRLIITAEAKKKNQIILDDQVVRQVKAAFQETDVDLVVPIAMTAAGKGIYIAEFEPVARADLHGFDTLQLASEAVYELVPTVRGI